MDEIFLKAKTSAEELVVLFAKMMIPEDLQEQEAIVEDSVCISSSFFAFINHD